MNTQNEPIHTLISTIIMITVFTLSAIVVIDALRVKL